MIETDTLKNRLKKRGITINMVAAASGCSTSTVSQILNEELNNKIKTTADRLCSVVDKEIMDSANSGTYL
ncbi:MAG: hypothetical protein Unbinned2902contig1001_32 [Prokaryotic dsDNA virus sp.]|nr:MAG: hypothetical protein Unbinned2902contig1001_32 [Prokaryotic dsDNA virus sp.]|tara:strand:- start:22867 stop:23076 length:210 start_codon:yes stop_codon:yes gene_type:complete